MPFLKTHPAALWILSILTGAMVWMAAGYLGFGAASNPGRLDDPSRIEPYLRTITADELAGYLHFLASDRFEGRETGTPGQRQAAKYLASEYQSLGLQPKGTATATARLTPNAYLQPFTVYKRQPTRTRIEAVIGDETIASSTFAPNAYDGHHYFSRGNAVDVTGEVVFLGYGIADAALGYDDYAALVDQGVSIEGKWVMLLRDEPLANDSTSLLPTDGGAPSRWTTNVNYKRTVLLQQGRPAGVLVVDDVGPRGPHSIAEDAAQAAQAAQDVGALSLYRSSPPNLPPTFSISTALADQMLSRSGHTIGGLVDQISETLTPAVFVLNGVEVSATIEPPEAFETENVLAFIEGIDPGLKDEVIVLTSHYDHLGIDPRRDGDPIYNGAADDASGTVACFEIAEAVMHAKRDGHGPRRSILFANFSGEEKGRLGSTYFVEHEPVVPLEQIAAVINMDGIAGYDPDNPTGSRDYVYVVGTDLLSDDLKTINARRNEALDINLNLAPASGWASDQRSFEYRFIPFLYYSTGLTEHYHQPSDEPATIDYEHMAKITRLVFATAWQAANQDERPEAHLRSQIQTGAGYVCPPCPVTPHHDAVYEHTGECPICRMHLVPNVRLNE